MNAGAVDWAGNTCWGQTLEGFKSRPRHPAFILYVLCTIEDFHLGDLYEQNSKKINLAMLFVGRVRIERCWRWGCQLGDQGSQLHERLLGS